ncbi:MAG: rod shape-determining protein RodA, partial [Tannerella sp.]|nr:rod shape-determining protein RodA [Tannerella sp.]
MIRQQTKIDRVTVILYIVLLAIGVISICGACFNFDNPVLFAEKTRPMMQLIWIGLSAVLIFLIMMLDKHFFETFSYILYGFMVVLLLITIFVAPDIKGSHSWLVITDSIRIQPAEFAKFATALALAKYIDNNELNTLKFKHLLSAVAIIFAPILLIVLQSETGSAIVFLALFLALYREGMSGYFLFASVCIATFFVIILKFDTMIWTYTPQGEFIVHCIIIVILLLILQFVFGERALAKHFLYAVIISATASYITSFFYLFDFTWVTIGLIIYFAIVLIIYSIRRLLGRFIVTGLFALVAMGFVYTVDYVFDEVIGQHQQTRIKVVLGMEDDP